MPMQVSSGLTRFAQTNARPPLRISHRSLSDNPHFIRRTYIFRSGPWTGAMDYRIAVPCYLVSDTSGWQSHLRALIV